MRNTDSFAAQNHRTERASRMYMSTTKSAPSPSTLPVKKYHMRSLESESAVRVVVPFFVVSVSAL